MAQTEAVVSTKTRKGLKEPSMFKVIYINDNTTTADFVIGSLMEFFGYSEETAANLTIDIHEQGSASVAVLPYEIAEQKGTEVTQYARSQNMPLQIKLEPDNG
jgi:ATP-dependent Clp protease adaptor protein ClpS